MPYLAGGLFRATVDRSIIINLCPRNNMLRESFNLEFSGASYKAYVITGFHEKESDQEKVQISYDKRAMLCGRLFLKKTGESVNINALDIDAILRSHGKELAENYWGRYLLLIFDLDGLNFYRDPQGLTLLYYTETAEGWLFSSSLPHLIDVLTHQISYNWSYLTSFISNTHQLTHVTPFNNVYEMLPGCETKITLNGKPKIVQFWDPTAVKAFYIEDENSFQEQLYSTAKLTLSSWVQGAKKVNIGLSGGLDSSSLLGLLMQSGFDQNVQAINRFDSAFSASDERDYAQDVCTIYQVPIKFFDMTDELPFGEMRLARRYDRPSTSLLNTNSAQVFLSALQIEKDHEMLSGQGGDHLFLAELPREGLVDYLLERGFQGSTTILKDTCAYYRMPYLSLLRESIKLYIDFKREKLENFAPQQIYQKWMTEDFIRTTNADIFKPFFWENLTKVSPGKAQQILSILSSTLYLDRGNGILGKPTIYPLLSQPLIELALSIPVYQMCKYGYNRYQYRKAMSKHLTGKFIWRKSKGESSRIVLQGIRTNYDILSSMLLEGECAQRGYIDRLQLNLALREAKSGNVKPMWPIINLFVVEKWLQSWKSSIPL